jgi:hypothetical protein
MKMVKERDASIVNTFVYENNPLMVAYENDNLEIMSLTVSQRKLTKKEVSTLGF